MTYQKIPGPFRRDPETNKLTDEWSSLELADLHDVPIWRFTEKIDGTNIRIFWDGYKVTFGGRTNDAQIPTFLLAHLEATFGGPDKETLFEQKFGDTPAILYGEGYGPKIQKVGAKYRKDVSFILFDAFIGGLWLTRESVIDIAINFHIPWVPDIPLSTTLDGAIEAVSKGLPSIFSNPENEFLAEGIVGVTASGLRDRRGNRIIVKIKTRDFHHE